MKNKIKKHFQKYKKSFNLLITWRLLAESIDKYKKVFKDNNINYKILTTSQYLIEKDLLKIIDKFDGIICGDDEITDKVIDNAINLKIISKWGTGIDSINKNYAKEKGITVLNSPGAFTKSVAQHGIALMFALTRNIVFNHKDMMEGKWTKRICTNLENKTIAIVGYGKIGRELFKQLKSFGSHFLFNDINKKKNTSLKYLLKRSDIIFIACDLNSSSRNLIQYKEILQMKKSSILINISRGSIINNNDLAKALRKKIILAAGLDVFDNEPLHKNSLFRKINNCILTSHNAFNSAETIKATNEKSVQNIINFLKK